MMKTIFVMLIAISASACTALKSNSFSDDAGAIRGYDPVAYFTEEKPVKGQEDIVSNYQGGVWHFSTVENRDLFVADPERFAPQYGGYCAYAMSKGLIVSIDPEAWAVKDEKLYLNYSLGVRKTWLKDPPKYIQKADKNWQNKSKLR